MSDNNDLQYVSLMSPPFSGSTLLSMLLCSQPRSIGFGDTYHDRDSSPESQCTCGVPFLECEPRVQVETAIREGGIPDYSWATAAPVPMPNWVTGEMRKHWPLTRSVSLRPIRAIPASLRRVMFRKFYLENRLMLSGLAETGNYDYYFDGCEDPVRLELLRTEIANLKVIQVIRHPGAFVYHFYRLGGREPQQALSQWIRYNNRVRSFQKYIPEENYMAVTYEHIVEKPGDFLREVAQFLDMDEIYDDPPDVLRRTEIHIQGNAMRRTADRVLNMANKWHGQLPEHLETAARSTLHQLPWAAAMYETR